MSRRLLFLVPAVVGVLAAQDPPSRIGRVSYLSGSVSFQPAGVTDWVPAARNRPLTVGDQIFADNGGLAEIQVPEAAFRLGSRTAFEFLNLDDQNVQVRLSEGTLNVRVRRLDENFEVDTPNLAFNITRPGEYRIDTNPDNQQTYVTVRDGEGQVTGNGGSFVVHRGEQGVVAGTDQSAQYNVYDAPAPDQFDQWVMDRNRREDRYVRSRYVSPEMVGYEDLDQYGTWRSDPGYGGVWVPNDVPAGWAPYQNGHWAWIDPWGWTWVDDEPWGFAPFHYGRWAYINGNWGWCPGPVAVAPVYAPALVAWVGFGGGFGVSVGIGGGPDVGWFPLGPRDVYIPAYSASRTYINRVNVTNTTVINNVNITNVYNTYTRTGNVPITTYANRSVPGAVVAVPRTALVGARPVQQVAVRVQPNQLNSIRAADPAPRVAPQVSSVLGHPASAVSRVPRPAPSVISRPVVAKAAPPPAPPAFQQRQTLLAKDPGRPLPVQQLRQMARTTPAPAAARPQVRVVSQARPVTPQVVHAPAPSQPATAATQNVPRPGQPPTGQPVRTQQQPPAVQQRATEPPVRPQSPAQAQQPRPSQPPAAEQRPAPGVQQVPSQPRPYEPPSAQRTAPPQAPRTQPQPPAQPNRTYEPPRSRPERPVEPAPAARRPAPAPPQANRTYEPPRSTPRRQEEPAPQARPQQARPSEPQRPAQQPPREQTRTPQPAPQQHAAPAQRSQGQAERSATPERRQPERQQPERRKDQKDQKQ